MRRPSHLLAAGCTWLLLAASTANGQDTTRRKVTLPTKPTYQRVVTRLCNIYQSGAMYCRNIDDLHAKEWAKVDRRQLQEMFKKIYEANGFDLRYNGLMSCGSGISAAARQSLGALPTAKDAKFAIDACLKQFGVAMGPGRGKEGAFGGAPKVPGGSGGSTVTGSCKVPGDPRRAEDAGTDVVETVEAVEVVWADEIITRDGTEYVIEHDMTNYIEPLVKEEQKDGGGKKRTEPGTSSCDAAVQKFMAMMAECARTGGTGYFCEKMKACSDPMVTNPNPGGPAIRAATAGKGGGEAVRCGEVEVFSEDQLRAALLKHCESKVQPGPDGGSPCAPRGGGSYSTEHIVKNICNNPVAIVTDECFAQQAGEVTFPTLRKNIQEVINEARAKIGGPLVVLPAPDPGTGPRPVCPPNCKAPYATESDPSSVLPDPATRREQHQRL